VLAGFQKQNRDPEVMWITESGVSVQYMADLDRKVVVRRHSVHFAMETLGTIIYISEVFAVFLSIPCTAFFFARRLWDRKHSAHDRSWFVILALVISILWFLLAYAIYFGGPIGTTVYRLPLHPDGFFSR